MNKKKTMIWSLVGICILAIIYYLVFLLPSQFKKNGDSVSSNEKMIFYDNPFSFIKIPENQDKAVLDRITETIDGTKIIYENEPGDWKSWIAIGNMYAMIEKYDLAIQSYERSIEITESNIVGYRNIAEVYRVNIKNYPLAEEYYTLAVDNNTKDPSLYITLSRLQHKKMYNKEEAERTLLKGVENTDSHEDLLVAIIKFYEDSGQVQKHKEAAKKLIARFPDNEAYKNEWGNLTQ